MTNKNGNALLVLPTFNRSGKLARTLDSYAYLEFSGKIVILDGSNQQTHISANFAAAARHHDLVDYVSCQGQDDLALRIRDYLLTIDNDVVAIGNDEDIFLPSFLEDAFEFMLGNPSYSAYVGGYLTVCRSIIGLKRISYWTDTFRGISIEHEDPEVRIVNFQRMNGHGVSPIYWSVRRREVLIKSLGFAEQLKYSSSSEFMDQITCCALGKIKQTKSIMLMRDESKIEYEGYHNRDAGKQYIDDNDLVLISKFATENWGAKVGLASKIVTSWYTIGGEGYTGNNKVHSANYCRFTGPELKHTIISRFLKYLLVISSKSGVIFSQFIAYYYYRVTLPRKLSKTLGLMSKKTSVNFVFKTN
jgi:glycosyltransferase domain-containing protein